MRHTLSPLESQKLTEMLALSALSYRGFAAPLLGENAAAVGVSAGLREHPAIAGRWELAWGPATSGLGVDSNAMFAARSTLDPSHFVIVIRGTSPMAVLDWGLGDLNVTKVCRWPFGQSDAALSQSSAYGLRELTRLRALRRRTPGPFDAVWGTTGAVARGAAVSAHKALSFTVQKAAQLAPLIRPAEHFVNLVVGKALALAQGPDLLSAALNRGPVVQPEELKPQANEAPDDERVSVLGFLRDIASRSAPIRVTVTGHSKGGAMAPVFALWLREALAATTGAAEIPIDCVSFAAPTPGNRAFAERVKSLGVKHHRVVNEYDIIPCGWEIDGLRRMPSLYGRQGRLLGPVNERVVRLVEHIEYAHDSEFVVSFQGKQTSGRNFALEAIYQHLDAYLAHFGILEKGNLSWFMVG